ncbi:MAG TPA: hypothetical protein VF383_01710 [Candidatus Dormibacteraeota bacterium]
MPLVRKIALVFSILFCGSVALAAAAMAAGGPGPGLPPGNYTFKTTFGNASAGSDPTQPQISVFVSQGLNSFKPKGGGPETVQNSTMVQIFISSPTVNGSDCFVVQPSDFTFASNVQSASLHTTLTTGNICTGIGKPVTGSSITAGVTPFAGGGGPGLPLPMTLDVTWTGLGVTGIGQDHNTFHCGSYSTNANSSTKSAGATASISVSAFKDTFDSSTASLFSSDTNLNVRNVPLAACFG